MSIHFPETNDYANSLTISRLNLPTGAATKSGVGGCVFGFWVRMPRSPGAATVPQVIAGRGGAYTGGADAYLRFEDYATLNSLHWIYRHSGNLRWDLTVAAPGFATPYLVLGIITAGYVHLVTCEPGGTPTVASVANTYGYNNSLNPLLEFLGAGTGSGSNNAAIPDMEECFFLHGLFPESGGVPDNTLIQNIADGTQDLATLSSQLTSGVNRFRYRLRDESDLSDAFGVFGDMAPNLTDSAKGIIYTARGPLRPVALQPQNMGHQISQVTFATPGDSTTATCSIPVEGGTYSGITPTAMQARLVQEDQTVLVDWTTFDVAPSGGTWAAGTLTDVPMTAGYLRLDIRAVDGTGTQIGDSVSSHGLRGAGFAIGGSSGQSQLMYLWGTGGGLALSSAARVVIQRVTEAGTEIEMLLGNGGYYTTRGVTRGMRQAANEINALYPGVPIQFATIGVAGTSPSVFATGGTYVANWQALADLFGIAQSDFFQLQMGHSSNSGHDTESTYRTVFEDTLAQAQTALGAPLKVILCPTPRYAGAGTGTTYGQVKAARDAMRSWLADNPASGFWAGSFSVVKSESSDVGPHPSDDDQGQGRDGTLIGRALMSACGAILDEPLEITSATAEGTSVRLSLGAINA